MTTWRFNGTLLPDARTDRLEVGEGEPQDLPGTFALPGLVDAHCHLTVDSDDHGPFLADRAFGERRLDEYAALGVTAVRDVGGISAVTLDFSHSLQPGRPRVTAAGRFLSSPGRYFPRMYTPVATADLDDAIRAEIAAGAEWVKLIADFPVVEDGAFVPDSTAPSYDLDAVRRAVATAHEAGARVAAHAQSSYAADLVAAGVDSIEHGTALEPDDVAALAARGGAWTPTMCAFLDLGPDPSDTERAVAAELSERYAALLPLAAAQGVRILTGSDVTGSVTGEILLLIRHGLAPEQALRAATTDAHDYLGLESGTDLVTFDTDPREHPDVLATPASVVIRGRRIR